MSLRFDDGKSGFLIALKIIRLGGKKSDIVIYLQVFLTHERACEVTIFSL